MIGRSLRAYLRHLRNLCISLRPRCVRRVVAVNFGSMDLKALKLELLERIALLDDEARLLALKRLLDSPRSYGIPNENLSVVKEGEDAYEGGAARTYTLEEVQRMLEEGRVHQQALRHQPGDLEVSDEELAILDERRDRHLKGESRSYTWDQVEEILKNDLKR